RVAVRVGAAARRAGGDVQGTGGGGAADGEGFGGRLPGGHVNGVRGASAHGAVGGDAGELDGMAADAEPGEGDASAAVARDRLAGGAVHGNGVAVGVEVVTRRAGGHPQAA